MMQTLLSTGVVGERTPQINFALPAPIREAFDALAADFPKKERWMVATAAILLLLEEGDSVRELVRAVNNAKYDRDFDRIVKWAKNGVFRDKAMDTGEDDGGERIASTGLKASSPAAHAKLEQPHQESPAGGGRGKQKVRSK